MRVHSTTTSANTSMTSAFIPISNEHVLSCIRESTVISEMWSSVSPTSSSRSTSPSCEPKSFNCPTTPRPQYFPSNVSPAKTSNTEWMDIEPSVVMPRKVSWCSMDDHDENGDCSSMMMQQANDDDDETSWYQTMNQVEACPILPNDLETPSMRKPLLMRRSQRPVDFGSCDDSLFMCL
ncbi:hypothetical protein MPSEU_000767700 [Mayamaea pseudoterrestris]|nr:hypothetical protein MPSEU_000767700 [Mayamaea pseudoterrestris]